MPTPPLTLAADDPRLTPTHTIDTPDRAALRARLVTEAIGDVQPPERGRPVLTLMGGGGGAGKGEALTTLRDKGQIPVDNTVALNPDDIKESIPEFREIMDTGDARAAEVVHEESSMIAKEILGESMRRGLGVTQDSTLGNPEKGVALIGSAQDQGYEVHLIAVTVDPEIAIGRAAERAAQTGRYVPIDHLLDAHRGFSQGFARYAEMADSVLLLDTNGPRPRKIAAKELGGELQIFDQESYDRFIAKGDLNPGARGPHELYGDDHRDGS